MKMPPKATWLPRHRHDGRFWDTGELMELLVVLFGAAAPIYPQTREYRALITIIRNRNGMNVMSKGHPFDWKGLRWEDSHKKDRVVQDKQAFAVKKDVAEYLELGRIPASALPHACNHLREAEVRVFADALVRRRPRKPHLQLIAAE